MKLCYFFTLLLFFGQTQCMDAPKLLYNDTSTQTVTVLSSDNKHCYNLSKATLDQLQTLKLVQEESGQTSIECPAIHYPHIFCLLLHHLDYSDEKDRADAISKPSKSLMVQLTLLANFLDVPLLVKPYTSQLCTMLTNQQDDTHLCQNLQLWQSLPDGIKEELKKRMLESRVHYYWVQELHNGKNKAFFIQPDVKPHTTLDYQTVVPNPILCKGTEPREPLECEELKKIPEFVFLQNNITPIQAFLLLLAKYRKEHTLSVLDLSKHALLQQAHISLPDNPCAQLKRLLIAEPPGP